MIDGTDNTPRAGDILFTDMDGIIPGLFPVGVGQAALFLTRRWWEMARRKRVWWTRKHVAIVDVSGQYVIQAMPKGCEIVPIGTRAHESRNVFIRPHYAGRSMHPAHEWVSGESVAGCASNYIGVPYNFATYLKLAAGAFRMRLTERWLIKHMSTRRDMMCSQHVDQSLADAGWHVFDDGRLPQDVVPAELFEGLLAQPGWFRVPGHVLYDTWTHNTRFPRRGL